MGRYLYNSGRSEPGEAQRARLDCNAHKTYKNLHTIHAKVSAYYVVKFVHNAYQNLRIIHARTTRPPPWEGGMEGERDGRNVKQFKTTENK